MSVCIDCADCVRQNTSDCDDCIVMFITSSPVELTRRELTGQESSKTDPAMEDMEKESRAVDAVVIDLEDYAALKRLHAAGMVPDLRHQTG